MKVIELKLLYMFNPVETISVFPCKKANKHNLKSILI